jgi:hypothetical protein
LIMSLHWTKQLEKQNFFKVGMSGSETSLLLSSMC